jgi:hypothetical protein
MKSGKNLLLIVVILISVFIPVALADTVVLKNGRELIVEKSWNEGDQLCFFFHGVKAGIPQSKISRIEINSDHQSINVAHKGKTKDDSKRIDGRFIEDVTRGQPEDTSQIDLNSSLAIIPTVTCTALRKDGFCDLQWGRKVSSVVGLEKKQTISDIDDVVEYVRPRAALDIGNAALESVIYAFWRDHFYTVTVWTKGYSNFTALRDAVFEEFGPGVRNDLKRERYLWSDPLSDMMLDYIQDGSYGMLWLRSKEMDRQCKSSQLKGHASFLKWMNSRK